MADFALLDRAVIRIAGPDAEKLLNDTLTGRIVRPFGGYGRWFALLTPQGKIITEGLIAEADDAFFLDIAPQTAADFVKRMKMYRLRARLDIDDISADTAVWWVSSEQGERPPGPASAYADDRGEDFGLRYLTSRAGAQAMPGDADRWHSRRIAAGIPELGADFPAVDTFPHDIGMDLLQGIDFMKGCYIGQEVVSRMKHRGTARRRPVVVSGAALEAGAPIMASGREAGTVGKVVGGKAVAIVRLDRVTDPSAVTVNDAAASLALPDWAPYVFGESAAAE